MTCHLQAEPRIKQGFSYMLFLFVLQFHNKKDNKLVTKTNENAKPSLNALSLLFTYNGFYHDSLPLR